MATLLDKIERLLKSPADGRRYPPVLIVGETGTGKSVLARALHRASVRRDGPFIPVNSTAITESVAESQMFGHERGLTRTPAKRGRDSSSWPTRARSSSTRSGSCR